MTIPQPTNPVRSGRFTDLSGPYWTFGLRTRLWNYSIFTVHLDGNKLAVGRPTTVLYETTTEPIKQHNIVTCSTHEKSIADIRQMHVR